MSKFTFLASGDLYSILYKRYFTSSPIDDWRLPLIAAADLEGFQGTDRCTFNDLRFGILLRKFVRNLPRIVKRYSADEREKITHNSRGLIRFDRIYWSFNLIYLSVYQVKSFFASHGCYRASSIFAAIRKIYDNRYSQVKQYFLSKTETICFFRFLLFFIYNGKCNVEQKFVRER